MTQRKVAVVAKGPTAILAPFWDPNWEIWGLTQVRYPRVDRLFDPHGPGHDTPRRGEHAQHANEHDIPVWCDPDVVSAYEHGVSYPLDAVVVDIGRSYFECTMAYMMALALYERVPHIGLWGVHLTTSDEYVNQRANIAWLIGLAEGRGVEVEISPGAPLLVSRFIAGRYGVNRERRF